MVYYGYQMKGERVMFKKLKKIFGFKIKEESPIPKEVIRISKHLTISEEVEKYLYRKALEEKRAIRERIKQRREAYIEEKKQEQIDGQISIFDLIK